MIKILLGTLMVGLAVGCAPEVAEEPSSSILVNPSSGVTIPEGLTVHDVDHNSDGTIDMDDLVIVGKFFGQNVPETGDLDMASDADNTDGYVYALMELTQFDDLVSRVKQELIKNHRGGMDRDKDYPLNWDKESINNELAYLSRSIDDKKRFFRILPIDVRFAFRFLIKTIDGYPRIIEVKVKPVNESKHNFVKKTITQSLDYAEGHPKTTTDVGGREAYVEIKTTTLPSDGYDFKPIKIGKSKDAEERIIGRVNIVVLRTNQRTEVDTEGWLDQVNKFGIVYWTDQYFASSIRYYSDRCHPNPGRGCYGSTYLTSDEVKAEYFPEDE